MGRWADGGRVSWTVSKHAVGRLRRLSSNRELTSIPSLLLPPASSHGPSFLSYANTSDLLLYALGSILSLLCKSVVHVFGLQGRICARMSFSFGPRWHRTRSHDALLAYLSSSFFPDRVSGALPFSGIDILYGRWASGLVNPNVDGSPPSPASIRALSQECAFIGIGITFGMWITTGGFFFCSKSSSLSIWSAKASL